MPVNAEEQLERLVAGNLELTDIQKKHYLESEDDLGPAEKGAGAPTGYKRCGKCGHILKFYLFNKNSSSKTNTSGNCKQCQRSTAEASYKKTKEKRNYKDYYQKNKETKQQHARTYYANNKDTLKQKHQEYLQTRAGKRTMKKAHQRRRIALAQNKGIAYTRAMVIERDGRFLGFQHPICYLCNLPIQDTSGEGLHIDHVIPVVEQGLDCFSNVACTHKQCNLTREKDARELTSEQVEGIIKRAEAYIDAYPDKFE